jgi:luciferase family oxidoreductase group 1
MTDLSGVRLSVLDTVPVWRGSSATQSLRNSTDLARRVERLGYTRYWVAEHHNTPCLATSVPPVLIAQIASATTTIRVGSGGVLLPNHAPLTVAEQFGTLEAFHPGRIDLGIGRASGTDPAAAHLLRRGLPPAEEDFPDQLGELLGYLAPGEPSSDVRAVPRPETRPPVYLLGTSTSSARFAGALGLPYAYAHQINPAGTVAALEAYRNAFKPSTWLDRPYTIVAPTVIAADSDERARWLARGYVVGRLLLRTEDCFTLFPTAEEAERHSLTPSGERFVREHLDPQIIGGPGTVRDRLTELVKHSGADELMALTMVSDHEARVRSYELLAELARS